MRVCYTASRKLALLASVKRIMEEEGLTLRMAAERLRVSHTLFVRWERQRDADGNPIKVATVGQKVELRLTAGVHKAVDRLVLGYMLRDKFGHVVWGTNTWHTRQIEENLAAGDRAVFSMTFTCTLGPGSYSVSPALVSGDNHLENNYEWVDNLLVFDVVNVDRDVFIGTNWLDASFVIDRTPGVDRGPDGGVA